MSKMTKEQALDEARDRLRGVAAHMVEKFGAEDIASIWLAQAMALLELDKGSAERAAQFLRDLADDVESVGVSKALAPNELN